MRVGLGRGLGVGKEELARRQGLALVHDSGEIEDTYGLDFLQILVRLGLGFHLGGLDLDHGLGICGKAGCQRDAVEAHEIEEKAVTYSDDILPLAGDMSTEINDLSGLFSSLLRARAMTAFPPLELAVIPCPLHAGKAQPDQFTTAAVPTHMLWPSKFTPDVRLCFSKNAAMSVAIASYECGSTCGDEP